jgi:hypothetical protein
MGPIGIGLDAGFTNRFADFLRCMIDRGVMDRAMGRMYDAMAAALEEADLGVSGVSANRQSSPMSMAEAGRRVNSRFGQSCVGCDGAEP